MGKNSTLIYLFSNFEKSELIFEGLKDYNAYEFDDIFNFIEKNTKKVPERIVDNIVQFSKNYS